MTLREQAEKLNISVHTLKNWQNRSESSEQGVENLVSRANKLSSSRQILPRELLNIPANAAVIKNIIDLLGSIGLSPEGQLLYFMIHFLRFKGFLEYKNPKNEVFNVVRESLETIIPDSKTAFLLSEELLLRLNCLDKKDRTAPLPPFTDFARMFPGSLNREYDLPGLCYQSLRKEGGRSRQGAWFTPCRVIDSMLKPYIRKKNNLFDPCCGSGLFLCRFAELKGSASGVSGMDLDPMAVFITRINLFIRFPSMTDFSLISEGDSLQTGSWKLKGDCVVATNPPWGAHMPPSVKKKMKKRYPEIISGESASLFIRRTVEELPQGGSASFLLPESLCYVQTHRDIRNYLLDQAAPVRMTPRGKLFHSVYSEVFSCDILKDGSQRKVWINGEDSHRLKRYKDNPDRIFNIHCSEKEAALIQKIHNAGIQFLPEKCIWLLGIVTGDNERFVAKTKEKNSLPLLTGKEIKPFISDSPRCWLRTGRGTLQQSRKIEEYSQPKLIYRFIGYTPLFSIDRVGLITLNSANSLVLPEKFADLEELVFWYNSALFKFLWLKQYHSVKMLRRQLENLPLPLWNKDEKKHIKTLVQNAENGQDISSFMNDMIFEHFKLNEEEKSIVITCR